MEENVLERGELFEEKDLEHGEENEHELELFEHGEKSPEDEAFDGLAKALGKEPKEVMEAYRRGCESGELSVKLEEAKSDGEIFEKLAGMRGISKEEMKKEILWALEKADREKIIWELQKENPGMNRKTAEELAKFRIGAREPKKAEPEEKRWDAKIFELDGFLAKHSGEGIEKLAAEVVEEWEKGADLESAFERHRLLGENERLAGEVEMLRAEMLKKEQKNYAREHSAGSANSSAGSVRSDEFIEGLFREY